MEGYLNVEGAMDTENCNATLATVKAVILVVIVVERESKPVHTAMVMVKKLVPTVMAMAILLAEHAMVEAK